MKPITNPRRAPYNTKRWQTLRLAVLRRDLYRCWVAGCQVMANVADHINPVYPGMPDAEFYDPANLRASCKRHNTARGVAARLERETAGQSETMASPRFATIRWSR